MSMHSRKQILILGLGALAFVLAGAITGLVVMSSGGGDAGSVRDLALQPADLPPEFSLVEETLFSREELMVELPADAQVAEQGLKEAVHLIYESEEGFPIVDVFVYSYEDEAAAEAAHKSAGQPEEDELRPVDLGDGLTGYAFADGLILEGIGEDAFLMTGYLDRDDEGESRDVHIYFMRSGKARAEVLVAGDSIFLQDPATAARSQYLRLERPDLIAAPRDP